MSIMSINHTAWSVWILKMYFVEATIVPLLKSLGYPLGPGENSLRFLLTWNYPMCKQPGAPKCSSFGFKKTWIGRIHEFSNSMELSLYLLPTFDVPPICTMATEIPGWHLQRAQKQRRGLLPPPQTFGRPECRGKEWRFDLPANHFPRLGLFRASDLKSSWHRNIRHTIPYTHLYTEFIWLVWILCHTNRQQPPPHRAQQITQPHILKQFLHVYMEIFLIPKPPDKAESGLNLQGHDQIGHWSSLWGSVQEPTATNFVSGNGAFNPLTSFFSKDKALPQCSKKGTWECTLGNSPNKILEALLSTTTHYNYKLHFPILYSMNVPGQTTTGSLQPFRPLPWWPVGANHADPTRSPTSPP